jgi:hypothetical protein
MEQNYGPEGIALMAAAILSGLSGALLGFVGVVFLVLSGGSGGLVQPGYYLLVVSVVLELPAIIRATQGIRAGRRFRAGRPLVRP